MPSPRAFIFVPALLILVLAGCREPKVTAYRAPKDVPSKGPAPDAAAAGSGGGMTGTVPVAGGEELLWTAPPDWESKPATAMRKATYVVKGDNGMEGELSITAFPGSVGGELANLNRWRGQLQLPTLDNVEAMPGVTHQDQAELSLTLADFSSLPPSPPQRMLGVIVPTAANTWFFKFSGPSALVEKARADFMDFVKTIRPGTSALTSVQVPAVVPTPSPTMAATPVPTAGGEDLKWTAPADWTSKPASTMRKATFSVPGENGADAELSITAFPGDVGGELANLNRWRGQVQLAQLPDATGSTDVSRFEQGGLKFTVADFNNTTLTPPQRMIGAIVPVGDATWFFKLTGPVTDKQKTAFLAFLKTVKTP